MLATTPSGSCVIRSSMCCLTSVWTRFLAQRANRFGQEEVDPSEEAGELVPRLADGLAHLVRERPRERLVHGDDPLAEPGDGFEPLPDRHLRPADLARARGVVLAADGRGVVGRDVGDDGTGGGIDDLHEGSALDGC